MSSYQNREELFIENVNIYMKQLLSRTFCNGSRLDSYKRLILSNLIILGVLILFRPV